MIDLQNPIAYKLITKIAVFNLILLAVDWILVYISSRELEALYNQIGIDALFNVGVYFFKLRATIIIIGSLVAFFKFWEMKDRKANIIDKWILRIAFILLITASVAAIETFLETIIRFV